MITLGLSVKEDAQRKQYFVLVDLNYHLSFVKCEMQN